MSPLKQVETSLIGLTVWSPSYGIVTVTDHFPGNVWSVEIAIDGRPVQWVQESEIFIIELGDTVVVNDHDTIYVGTITRVYADSLKAFFEVNGRTFAPTFDFSYIIEILPADVALLTSAV